jgi:hypothetical protein
MTGGRLRLEHWNALAVHFKRIQHVGLVGAMLVTATGGCVSESDGTHDSGGATTYVANGNDIANLALANVGNSACGMNSLGGYGFESSCTGAGGSPELWCSDFARWVWEHSGADTTTLTAASGTFYTYGLNNNTLSNTPQVGAAVVFNYSAGWATHVAIVTKVNSNGTIESVSGDWGGQQGGSDVLFASTAHVLHNSAYNWSVGTTPGVMGETISGYIMPAGTVTVGDCAVHDDGRLYCGNKLGSPLYSATSANSSVVDHLRNTPSWFDCWSTGDLHAGGNTTWYHTQGDDSGSWGWTPAVNLNTTSSLDANPTAAGLHHCP